MDKIDTWIENRFGTPNTFNRQLLDNFIEFLEKELGYVIKDPDQSLPSNPDPKPSDDIEEVIAHNAYKYAQEDMLLEHWVKEKSNE